MTSLIQFVLLKQTIESTDRKQVLHPGERKSGEWLPRLHVYRLVAHLRAGGAD